MQTKIRWLGQAGVLLVTPTASIAVDPFCGTAKDNSVRNYPNDIEKGSIRVDMVLTTHSHWDHFDPETYRDYVIPQAIVGPTSCMKALEESGLEIEGIRLDRGETIERCGVKIGATFADHSDPYSVGYLVSFDGYKLYFSGDSLLTTDLLVANAGMEPDLTFICINGKLGNMNYHEAASYCRLLGTKVGIPVHYDMIRHNTENPKEFVDSVARQAPGVRVRVLERGVDYTLEELLG